MEEILCDDMIVAIIRLMDPLSVVLFGLTSKVQLERRRRRGVAKIWSVLPAGFFENVDAIFDLPTPCRYRAKSVHICLLCECYATPAVYDWAITMWSFVRKRYDPCLSKPVNLRLMMSTHNFELALHLHCANTDDTAEALFYETLYTQLQETSWARSNHSLLHLYTMTVVYTLQLADGCFYVGRVKDLATLESRVEQHKAGHGSEWTKLHPVVELYSLIDDAKPTDEDAQVISLVAEHGVEKVRGGTFCTPVLTDAEVKILNKMADSTRGSCYQCHETGHCTNECPISLSIAMSRGNDWECPDCGNNVFAKNDSCPRCGKWKPKEFKTITAVAGRKPGDWDCPKCGDHQFSKNTTCRKCRTPKGDTSLKRPRDDTDEKAEKESSPKKARIEPEVKSGDWICDCETHNFASRTTCFKCKKAKPSKDAERIGTCVICLDKPVRVAVQPCGHLCYCDVCAVPTTDECPLCRKPVIKKQTIFQ